MLNYIKVSIYTTQIDFINITSINTRFHYGDKIGQSVIIR